MWLCPGLSRHAGATGMRFGYKQGKINVLQRQTGFCPLGAISVSICVWYSCLFCAAVGLFPLCREGGGVLLNEDQSLKSLSQLIVVLAGSESRGSAGSAEEESRSDSL